MENKTKILFLAANPKIKGTDQLRLDEEIREIQDRDRLASYPFYAAALGEQLVDRGHIRERADLGDRDVQSAFGDQIKDPTQAGGGAA